MYYQGKKVLYQSVFDLFHLTYMDVDFDFRLFSDWKAEGTPLRHEKKL